MSQGRILATDNEKLLDLLRERTMSSLGSARVRKADEEDENYEYVSENVDDSLEVTSAKKIKPIERIRPKQPSSISTYSDRYEDRSYKGLSTATTTTINSTPPQGLLSVSKPVQPIESPFSRAQVKKEQEEQDLQQERMYQERLKKRIADNENDMHTSDEWEKNDEDQEPLPVDSLDYESERYYDNPNSNITTTTQPSRDSLEEIRRREDEEELHELFVARKERRAQQKQLFEQQKLQTELKRYEEDELVKMKLMEEELEREEFRKKKNELERKKLLEEELRKKEIQKRREKAEEEKKRRLEEEKRKERERTRKVVKEIESLDGMNSDDTSSDDLGPPSSLKSPRRLREKPHASPRISTDILAHQLQQQAMIQNNIQQQQMQQQQQLQQFMMMQQQIIQQQQMAQQLSPIPRSTDPSLASNNQIDPRYLKYAQQPEEQSEKNRENFSKDFIERNIESLNKKQQKKGYGQIFADKKQTSPPPRRKERIPKAHKPKHVEKIVSQEVSDEEYQSEAERLWKSRSTSLATQKDGSGNKRKLAKKPSSVQQQVPVAPVGYQLPTQMSTQVPTWYKRRSSENDFLAHQQADVFTMSNHVPNSADSLQTVESPYRVLPPIPSNSIVDDLTPRDVKPTPRHQMPKSQQLTYSEQYEVEKQKEEKRANNEKNYQIYTLDDYKRMNREVKLGGLGPDLDSETLREKKDKAQRKQEYAKQVQEKNRQDLRGGIKKSSSRPNLENLDKEDLVSARSKAINYAKQVKKPPKQKTKEFTSPTRPVDLNMEENPELIDLEALRERHEMERQQALLIQQQHA